MCLIPVVKPTPLDVEREPWTIRPKSTQMGALLYSKSTLLITLVPLPVSELELLSFCFWEFALLVVSEKDWQKRDSMFKKGMNFHLLDLQYFFNNSMTASFKILFS